MLQNLNNPTKSPNSSAKMPVLFLGHGNPMNAIEENEFVEGFRNIATTIPTPTAILCISAHWETRGTQVTAMEKPTTIHDFGGFPRQLFETQYPAPGSPKLANEVKSLITKTEVGLDMKWGLDHGAWSVLKHLYPNATIPVVELSLDYNSDAQSHYDLAKQLKPLREKGILIIGSGNIIHNLRLVEWSKFDEHFGHPWAIEVSEKVKQLILNNDHQSLIDFDKQGKAFHLAMPTPEHFLPLLYVLALKDEGEKISIFNDQIVAGALSMTSIKIDGEQTK